MTLEAKIPLAFLRATQQELCRVAVSGRGIRDRCLRVSGLSREDLDFSSDALERAGGMEIVPSSEGVSAAEAASLTLYLLIPAAIVVLAESSVGALLARALHRPPSP